MTVFHTAHLRARADAVEQYKARLLRHARTSLEREPGGCLRFDVHQDLKDPTLFLLIEIYRDRHADRSIKRAWVDLIGELVFRIPSIHLAEAEAGHGAPVYMYRFDWESPAFGGRLGAAHALELPFVWNRLDLPMAPILLGNDFLQQQPLATAMHGAWAQFIRTGDPNGGGLPDWPRYDPERRATLLIDRDSRVEDDPAGAARELWPASWPTA